MIKFEVGKVYEKVDAIGNKIPVKVITRSDNFLITKTIIGSGADKWEKEQAHLITVMCGVEYCLNSFYLCELSATKEAKTKGVKEGRKPVCFEVGKEYLTSNGEIWECKAVFDANNRRVGVFYNKDTDVNLIPTIKTHNSVEYTLCGNLFNELNFIADEQYRDEIKALL